MEDDVTPADTYDIPDGCVFSKTTTDKVPASDDPIEYASSPIMRQLADEHKSRSLPRLPRTPSGDGIYSIASGDKSPDPSEDSASLYSSISEQSSSSYQLQPLESSGQDIYSVVDKSNKQLATSSAQAHDIYSVVDKSAKKDNSSDKHLSSSSNGLHGITHKPMIKKKPVKPLRQPSEELYSVVQKNSKPVVQDKPEDVFNAAVDKRQQPPVEELYSVVNKPSLPNQSAQHEQLYSVVNKPPVKVKPQKTPLEDIYSEVTKPTVRPSPMKYNSENNILTNSTTSVVPPVQPRRSRVKSSDLYEEVKPRQIENGDIYAVINKPKPPPVAKKPAKKQRRIVSDSSVTMETGMQEDNQSYDSGVEDEPTIPDRCYNDDDLEFDDEPPELPPRLYSLSDFDTEDELCFDDIMEDFNNDRTYDNPLYESTLSLKPSVQHGEVKQEESNPLYQTLASIRKEMDENKSKTGTLKVSKYCYRGYCIIFYSN